MQYAAFSDWLLCLSNRRVTALDIFLWLDGPFLFMTKYFAVCVHQSLFTHSPTEEHFGCFQDSVIMNKL